MVSLLAREVVEALGLEPGVSATSRVKSTNVHIDVGCPPDRAARAGAPGTGQFPRGAYMRTPMPMRQMTAPVMS